MLRWAELNKIKIPSPLLPLVLTSWFFLWRQEGRELWRMVSFHLCHFFGSPFHLWCVLGELCTTVSSHRPSYSCSCSSTLTPHLSVDTSSWAMLTHNSLLIAAVYMSGSATHVTQKTLGEKKQTVWDVGRNRSSWGICRQLFSPHFSPLSWYYIFPLYSLPFPRPYDDDSSSLLMYTAQKVLLLTLLGKEDAK